MTGSRVPVCRPVALCQTIVVKRGKAFDLAFNPASKSHLRSCASGGDWNGQGQAHEMRFPRLATGRRLRSEDVAETLLSSSGLDHCKLAL